MKRRGESGEDVFVIGGERMLEEADFDLSEIPTEDRSERPVLLEAHDVAALPEFVVRGDEEYWSDEPASEPVARAAVTAADGSASPLRVRILVAGSLAAVAMLAISRLVGGEEEGPPSGADILAAHQAPQGGGAQPGARRRSLGEPRSLARSREEARTETGGRQESNRSEPERNPEPSAGPAPPASPPASPTAPVPGDAAVAAAPTSESPPPVDVSSAENPMPAEEAPASDFSFGVPK